MIVPALSPFNPQALSGDWTFSPLMFKEEPVEGGVIEVLNENTITSRMITKTTKTMIPIGPVG